MGRSKKNEQRTTVAKLFLVNDISLNWLNAGRTLYQSLAKAKERTRTREDYIAKGIKFMFNPEDKKALLEVIQGDNDFWQAWINQNRIFDRTGLQSDRPTIHRLNPDENYEFGNIAVLLYGEHQQEHAVATAMVTFGGGTLSAQIFGSKTTTANVIGVGTEKVNNMAKRGYAVIDEATGVDTGHVALTMPVKRLNQTNSEEEYKAQCEAEGLSYESPEARTERDERMIANIVEKEGYSTLEGLENTLRKK